MWDDWQGGVFALPPGVDFGREVVEGLIARTRGKPPEALAAITLLANSARTLRSLQEAWDSAAVRHGPLLLPAMRLIADLGAELPGSAAAPLGRRLELARLVAALIERQPDLATAQSVPRLARSLYELMTEMQSEGCGPADLAAIDAGGHAAHWQRSLAFLKIAAEFHLTGDPVDGPARQRRAAEAMADAWASGKALPAAPVVVVGSTGSHGATRLYLRAVAALPLGAVVLPGMDPHMPDGLWELLASGEEDHPQARLAALRAAADGPVRGWTATAAPDEDRNRVLSLALRPAPVTDQWIAEGPSLPPLPAATAGLTLIEADQPQQEADALAVLIRDAVQRGQKVRLFAADRGIVRRIGAALDRWGLAIDDSAGEPLHLTAPGLFLRHLAALMGQALTVDALLVLLKHPVTATGGGDHGVHLRHTRELELQLREHGPAFPDAAALRAWAERAPDAGARLQWVGWLAPLLDRIAALSAARGKRPLGDAIAAHLGLADALAAGPRGDAARSRLWNNRQGQAMRIVMAQLAEHAAAAPPMAPGDYADLLLDQLSAQAIRPDELGHPLIRACGPREARTEANRGDGALVIVAGLNEGGWPQPLAPDPWLSRAMRAEAGLTVPERLIGLSAHDFQQAAAAPQVVLSRACRDDEAETVPSRWLNRLINLLGGLPEKAGDEALSAMRSRGRHWLDLAATMATPRAPAPLAPRPSPVPPPGSFREISVTQVRTLIRDPYAIYASKVLGLRPLRPLRAEPDALLRGNVLHGVAERMLTPAPPAGTDPATLRDAFLRATEEVLADEVPWPAARMFWQARMARIADRIARDEAERLQRGRPVVVERRGRLAAPGLDLVLTAKPDRIDLVDDGSLAHVYDYKTGKPPTQAEMDHFDKQLILEAAMVMNGAFDRLGVRPVEGVSYIHLGGEGETCPRGFSAEAAEDAWRRLIGLARQYLTGAAGFTARRAMQKTGHAGDYDHLARRGEWDEGTRAVRQIVGDHGGDHHGDR